MSLDIFVQQFVDGDAGPGGNAEARAVLEPYLIRDADATITGLRTDDGEAEVYGLDDESGFMVTHASGDQVWDLLVSACPRGRSGRHAGGVPRLRTHRRVAHPPARRTHRPQPGGHERCRPDARDHHGVKSPPRLVS